MPKVCRTVDCNNLVFSNGYCKLHQYLNVKAKINRLPKPKKEINPISPQLRKKIGIYSQLREEFLAKYSFCKANLPNCGKIATDIHHMKGRGKYLNDASTWLPVCRNCHHRIELFPVEAKQLGLSQSRLTHGKSKDTI